MLVMKEFGLSRLFCRIDPISPPVILVEEGVAPSHMLAEALAISTASTVSLMAMSLMQQNAGSCEPSAGRRAGSGDVVDRAQPLFASAT